MKRPPGITPPPPPAEPEPADPPAPARGRGRGAKPGAGADVSSAARSSTPTREPRPSKPGRRGGGASDPIRDAETAPIGGLTRGSSGSGLLEPGSQVRSGAPADAARDAAETAPIGRPRSWGRGARVESLPGVASTSGTTSTSDATATMPIGRLGGAGTKAAGPAATGTTTAPRPNSDTPASGTPDYASGDARRELRKASRRRRRYERSEARRFTQRSRRRRLTWIVVGASLAGLVLVVLLAAYSPLLAVRTLAIEGTSRLDAAAVTAALQPQVGKPLALVDYGAIESELAGFPLIASYSVEARPPDTLAVRIVERRPVAQVQTATGFDLIDAAGVTVQQSAERIAGFPLLDLSGTQIGSRGFDAAAAVLAALPDTILGQVDRISGTTPDSVTMVFGGVGQRVVWGSAENSDLKARILERLIATQDPNRAVEYDVSSPQSPVVR